MQKPLEQQISEAKARAMAARIEIDTMVGAPVGSYTLVTSEQDATIAYAITRDPEGNLTCSCPARVVCKHIGLVLLRGMDYHVPPGEGVRAVQLAAFWGRDAVLIRVETSATEQNEASIALALAERSERALIGQPYSQEERLRALAYLPVVIAAYAVVLGPSHARLWYQAKEDQWERYQACRMSQCWY